MTMKKKILTTLSVVLILGMAALGILAYLTSQDSDVNVMTLGNVSIEQHEYERVVDENGNYEKTTVTTKSGSTVGSYKVQEFTQAKPLLPATGEITGWDDTSVRWEQLTDNLLAVGGQRPFTGLNNVQDKFVLVENTGKTDAYVRTMIALEYGSNVKDIIGISTGDFWTWDGIGIINVDGNNYYLYEAIYKGADGRHDGGILPAGEYTYNSLGQVYLANEATNEDCEALDGNNNGTYDILVLSQAVQAEGFADAKTALDAAFGDITTTNHPWSDALVSTPEDAQAALDKAKSGDVIQLAPGVDYGTLYVRPTANNDTTMYCGTHDYVTDDAEEFKAHLSENGYHTTPEYTTELNDVKIIGAEGATVAGFVVTSGHSYGDVYDYVLDKDYSSGSAYYSTLNISNLTFENVNFTGKVDINTADADSVYDGVTFDKCTFTTGGTYSANGAAIRYYNESNNGNVKNIVVKNCKFNNCYQGVYVHHVNGVTVTSCEFDTIGHNAIAIQNHDGAVNLKNVVITDNTFKNIADRVIRFGDVGADSNITIQNNVATNSGDEDGEVMKATTIAQGVITSITKNTWNGTVVNDELKNE